MHGDANCPCHKTVKDGQPTIIIWTNLVDFESLILYTKIQPQSFKILSVVFFLFFFFYLFLFCFLS